MFDRIALWSEEPIRFDVLSSQNKTSKCICALFFCLLTLFFASLNARSGFAQTATYSIVKPQPNFGRDYINLLNESVDPATGIVNIRINLPLPKQRGFNLPFSFLYDSGVGGLFTAAQTVSQGMAGIIASAPSSNGCTESGAVGWHYTFPCLSTTESDYSITLGDAYTTTISCLQMGNYVFYDPLGNAHQLRIRIGQTDAGSQTGSCDDTASTVTGIGTYVSAISSTASIPKNATTFVVDANGTTYSFASPGSAGSSDDDVNYAVSVSTIEDRNGNTITYNRATRSYTDSLGRTLLAHSHNSTANTDTFSISGLTGLYTVTWSDFKAKSYTLATSPDTNYSGCTPGGDLYATLSSGITSVSSITLPNNEKYTFDYDANYGTISSITYPNGTVVSYRWGIQPGFLVHNFLVSEKDARMTGPYNYVVTTHSCPYFYDAVVVKSRSVSVEGVPVLTQTFDYTSPTSGSYISKTTITTNDLISSATTISENTYADYMTEPSELIPVATLLSISDSAQSASGGLLERNTGYARQENSEIVKDSSGSAIKTVAKTWNDLNELASVQTTLNSSSTTLLETFTYGFDGVVTEHDEYGYGPSSATRKTLTSHQSFTSRPFASTTLQYVQPSSVIVYEGNSNKLAETDYSYDQTGVTSVSATGHDDTNYSSGSTLSRGNVTTVTRKCLQSCTDQTTAYTYDSTGQVITQTDANGNRTTYSYTDSDGGTTNAYLTHIAYPTVNGVAHTNSFQYDYATGNLTEAVDENNQPTNYFYSDPLNRLTAVQGPTDSNYNARPTTTYSYSDSGSTPSITTTTTLNSGLTKSVVQVMDGLGRTIQTQTSDANGTIYVNTLYDGRGNVYQQSNPTRCSSSPGSLPSSCSESTWGYTAYSYDGLNRKTQAVNPGNTSRSWSYSGNVTTFTDENSHSWRQINDAFGRLTQVVEPGSLTTSYTYDVLNNLLTVNQAGNSDTARNRSFSYDSLSQLVCASNPENSSASCPTTGSTSHTAGTTGYSYDNNSNLTQRIDARNMTTAYLYDALNRVTSKRYSDGVTPSSCYQYESTSISNGKGRLLNEWTQSATAGACASALPSNGVQTVRSILAYDAMGRVTSEQQQTPASLRLGTNYPLTYRYDLVGNLIASTTGAMPSSVTLTSPSNPCSNGATFSSSILSFVNCYDAVGRLASVTSNGWTGSDTLFSQPSYAAFGGLANATYGDSAVTLTRSYDNRLRPAAETDTGNSSTSTSGSATVTIIGAEQNK
jgi:YD repeat-containing protein